MNSFGLPLIVIIALISIILIYIRKLRDKSDITPDIKQDVETGEIDDLFNNTIEEVNTHLPQKIKQKEFRVILKNKGWWNRNNPFIWGLCAISFIAILMLVLSSVAHRKYSTQQEISIQKEHQKILYKDSMKNEQIELISSELSDIDKTIRETNRIIRRVEKQIKDIKENDF
jgi:heme exporter protein D